MSASASALVDGCRKEHRNVENIVFHLFDIWDGVDECVSYGRSTAAVHEAAPVLTMALLAIM